MELNVDQIRQLMKMNTEDLAELALTIAEKYPDAFIGALNAAPKTRRFTVPYAQGLVVAFTSAELRKLREFRYSDQKVSCIKIVRTLTGLGLKEAKDLVEGGEFQKFLETGV